MKKFPFSITAVILIGIFFGAFIFIPSGQDLISPTGDYYLGQILGILVILAIVFDVIRIKNNSNKS